MPDILLSTLNAIAHAAFGLRYLLANLGELQPRAEILEFDIGQRPIDIAEQILARKPRILGLASISERRADDRAGRHSQTLGAADDDRARRSRKWSHEHQLQEIVRLADFTITGEADLEFAKLCAQLLRGQRPLMSVVEADPPHFNTLRLPYRHYTDADGPIA